QAEPQGPVYLTLPREVLAEKHEVFEYAAASRAPKPSTVAAAPEAIAETARLLADARNPIILTKAAGRDPLAVAALVKLAEALADAVRQRVDGRAVAERTQRWHAEHRRLREAWAAAAKKAQSEKPLEMVWVSKCVGDLVDDNTILVDEYDFDPTQGCFRTPRTYFGSSPAGGLGWGMGAALGAKLAAPDKTVICCIGDGAYIFSAPTAAHFVSRAYNLPVLF